MSKTTSIILQVAGVILLLVIAAGVAFQFGYGQGVSNSPAVAEQMEKWLDKTGELPASYAYRTPGQVRYYNPFIFGTYPVSRLIGIVITIFLFFTALRLIFFRPWAYHRWHHHMHPWAPYWEGQPYPPNAAQPQAPQAENK